MKPSVLIVDDSMTVRMDLAEAFEGAAFRVLHCGTAGEARDLLVEGPVDAILLDVVLPDADGVKFLKELRTLPASAESVVLLLSSDVSVKDRVRNLETSADGFVGKPYDREAVVGEVRELLRNRPADGAAKKATVLVIDASAAVRDQMKAMLESAGFSVLTAPDGEEGLRIAGARRPDAIIVDGALPGIDGATVIRRLRLDTALRATPCLLLSEAEDRDAELRALDAGADAFVRKDEPPAVIQLRLAAILRRAAAAGPGDGTATVLGPKRILAVDDSMTYLQELASALRDGGFEVVLAHSGEEALELLAAQPMDCVLLDLLMPGLSGQETCRRIKSVAVVRDTPVIMLTANEDSSSMIEGLSSGADDFISKSSEFDVLRARVLAQIRRKQLEDEHRRIRAELHHKTIEASDARAAQQLAETRAVLTEDLKRANQELEAFSYSVSHDLRAPLRAIDGFSKVLLEDQGERLDEAGRSHLARICAAAARMSQLIDDLLGLSLVSRCPLGRKPVSLTEVARTVVDELRRRDPARVVVVDLEGELIVQGDPHLLGIIFENLLGNAWKFTHKQAAARIAVGERLVDGHPAYFVEDNGAGFDMAYAAKLFQPFQRLHSQSDYEGTGIGLAIVNRIVLRHGGRIWAKGVVNEGATFYFTLEGKMAVPPVMRVERKTVTTPLSAS